MKGISSILVAGAVTACLATWHMVPLDGILPTAAAAVGQPREPLQLPAGMTKKDRAIIEYAMNIWPDTVRASLPNPPNFLDADTFDLMVRDPSRSWTQLLVRFRVSNINAPEVRSPKCDAERKRAAAATEFVVMAMSAPGAVIEVTNKDDFDENGRYLAQIRINGKDLGEMLMAQNPPLARAWTDQYEGQSKNYWCSASQLKGR